MSSTYVRSSFDPDNAPPLTPEQEAELARLAEVRDEDIDYSDIPESDLSKAIRFQDSPFYNRHRHATVVRLDADVLAWLKAKGRGYQTRLNAILREAMLKEVG